MCETGVQCLSPAWSSPALQPQLQLANTDFSGVETGREEQKRKRKVPCFPIDLGPFVSHSFHSPRQAQNVNVNHGPRTQGTPPWEKRRPDEKTAGRQQASSRSVSQSVSQSVACRGGGSVSPMSCRVPCQLAYSVIRST